MKTQITIILATLALTGCQTKPIRIDTTLSMESIGMFSRADKVLAARANYRRITVNKAVPVQAKQNMWAALPGVVKVQANHKRYWAVEAAPITAKQNQWSTMTGEVDYGD